MIRRINVFNEAGVELVMQAIGMPTREILRLLQYAQQRPPCTIWIYGCGDQGRGCEFVGFSLRPFKSKTPFCEDVHCDECQVCPGCGLRWTRELVERELDQAR